MFRRIARDSFLVIGGTIALLMLVDLLYGMFGPRFADAEFGATFSKPYAESLGLDWKQVYADMLDDLDLRLVRVPAYWDEIEPQPGQFDFADLDWQVAEARKRGAKVIITVGRKVPRWPECHNPSWTGNMDPVQVQDRLLAMMKIVVQRFAPDQDVIAWQVENEPFLNFGQCPRFDRQTVKREVALVRSLDARPIWMQVNGEFSMWLGTASIADVLGISVYRTVWVPYLGLVHWPGIGAWYRLRGALARLLVKDIYLTELQAEPWFVTPITAMPLDEQFKQMNPDVLKDNVSFSRSIGFSQIYFWGVEWWYWLKTQGHPELWEAAKQIIAKQGAAVVKK